MGHLQRVWHADRGRLLLRTPGPVPLGLAYVLLVETNPFPNLSFFYRTMLFEYPSVLSRFCLKHCSVLPGNVFQWVWQYRGQSYIAERLMARYHAGHTRKASRISKAAVDNCGKGVGNFYLS